MSPVFLGFRREILPRQLLVWFLWTWLLTKSQKAINFHAYKDSMILKYIDANTGEPIKLYNEADFDNYDWGGISR